MSTVLISPRLAFSPFVATDLDLLIELHSDPEIMRYLSPDGRPWPREVIVGKARRLHGRACCAGAFEVEGLSARRNLHRTGWLCSLAANRRTRTRLHRPAQPLGSGVRS